MRAGGEIGDGQDGRAIDERDGGEQAGLRIGKADAAAYRTGGKISGKHGGEGAGAGPGPGLAAGR